MYELDEKIDLKKADMGEVIKDFRKSDTSSKVRPKRRNIRWIKINPNLGMKKVV